MGKEHIMIKTGYYTDSMTRNSNSTFHRRLTYFLACKCPILLNMTSRHLGNTPWSCGEPAIVKVLPEHVTPYANSNAGTQSTKQSCIKVKNKTMINHLLVSISV